MTRQQLLGDEHGARIFALPSEERDVVRHCTLTADGLAVVTTIFGCRPAEDRAALLAAVLADRIDLGLTCMAESCHGPMLRQLAWTHDWHGREECYAAALARLIEAHRALPLAALWGDGTTSSSIPSTRRSSRRPRPRRSRIRA
jgi:hypothetical protein